MKRIDIINKRYFRLRVLSKADHIGGRTAWLCQCDCGATKIVKTDHLTSGTTKFCGCLNDEKRKSRASKMYSKNIKYSPMKASARKVWRDNYHDGISFDDFYKISQKNCYYCNATTSNIANNAKSDKKASKYALANGDFTYNGLDRIDPFQNHNIDNVVPCCKYCNYAKRERSLDEFKLWISAIYHHLVLNEKVNK